MAENPLFEHVALAPWRLHDCYLGEVVSVQDPDGLARVQVRVLAFDGVADQDAPLWARVAAPFAGASRGGFFIPDVGDEVLLAFVQGDPRHPVVLGGLWNGQAAAPEALGGDRVDRWALVSKAGSRIAIVEQSQPTITLETPGGVKATLSDEGGGRIELQAAGSTITIDSGGVSVQTGSRVSISASSMSVSAGSVSVDAGVSSFSGMVRCDVLQATTVIASTYTPGAGNIW